MADSLSVTRDIIYVVCTPITTFLAIFALFWWERRNRIQDKKEAQRKANEEKEKADKETILALLTNDFVEVVENYQDLKKRVNRLKNNTIDTGSCVFTEFDILLYMYHGDNCHLFNTLELPYSSTMNRPTNEVQNSAGREWEKLVSDVEVIFTFFKAFAFRLSVIDEACPANFRSEFSADITAMGQIIYPFRTEDEQKLIHKVVTYFGNTKPGTLIQENKGCLSGCIPWRRRRQATCDPETQALVMIERGEQPNANQQANEGLKTYPGRNAIETAIPYVQNFWYRNGEMYYFVGFCKDYTTSNLMKLLMEGQLIEPVKEQILHDIKALWSDLSGDLLHQLRMILFKQVMDPTFFAEHLLSKFHQNVQPFTSPDIEVQCQAILYNMHNEVEMLLRDHKHLLKDESTSIFLKQHAERLRVFVALKLRTPTEDDRKRRRSSF